MSETEESIVEIVSSTGLRVRKTPYPPLRENETDFFMRFEITFGPRFPIKQGASYKELYEYFREAYKKEPSGSLAQAYFSRCITAMELELAAASDKDAVFERIFTGKLWCNFNGCGSCGDCGAFYYCEITSGCESCGGYGCGRSATWTPEKVELLK